MQESGSSVEIPHAQSTFGLRGESAFGRGNPNGSRIPKTNLVTSSTRGTSIGEAGRPIKRLLTKPWTDGWSEAFINNFPMTFPISFDLGNLERLDLGFLIPPIACSFSKSLSFCTAASRWGVWYSPQSKGSEWSSLSLSNRVVLPADMAPASFEFSWGGYSPNALEALSLSPFSFTLHLPTRLSCFALYVEPSGRLNSWILWSHRLPSMPDKFKCPKAKMVGLVVSAPKTHWSSAV